MTLQDDIRNHYIENAGHLENLVYQAMTQTTKKEEKKEKVMQDFVIEHYVESIDATLRAIEVMTNNVRQDVASLEIYMRTAEYIEMPEPTLSHKKLRHIIEQKLNDGQHPDENWAAAVHTDEFYFGTEDDSKNRR